MGMAGNKGHKWLSTDRLAGRVLALLTVLTALMFGAFFVVGYDMPYAEDPAFNAPLLTDTLLVYTYALCAVAVVVAVVSMVRGAALHGGSRYETNGVPSGRIALGVALLLVVTLVLTFVFGSSEPLPVNGKVYGDELWLKLTDMFIGTSAVLGLVAVALVAVGVSGLNRRTGRKER